MADRKKVNSPLDVRTYSPIQITNVLQKNDDSFNPFRHDLNHDVYDSSYKFNGKFRQFVIPKRLNYGTYKPTTYPTRSRCTCDDRMPPPIVIYNEMQIVTADYEWIEDPDNPPLEDASKTQFNNLKRKAELSVSTTVPVNRNEHVRILAKLHILNRWTSST